MLILISTNFSKIKLTIGAKTFENQVYDAENEFKIAARAAKCFEPETVIIPKRLLMNNKSYFLMKSCIFGHLTLLTFSEDSTKEKNN